MRGGGKVWTCFENVEGNLFVGGEDALGAMAEGIVVDMVCGANCTGFCHDNVWYSYFVSMLDGENPEYIRHRVRNIG